MSIWADIYDRSTGDANRSEDIAQIYGGDSTELLYSEEYKHCTIEIYTNGMYPCVYLTFDSMISVFAGKDLVILKDEDGNRYELDRFFDNGSHRTRFSYFFNKEGDYIFDKDGPDDQDGVKYTLETLKEMAKMFVDRLIKCEKELFTTED